MISGTFENEPPSFRNSSSNIAWSTWYTPLINFPLFAGRSIFIYPLPSMCFYYCNIKIKNIYNVSQLKFFSGHIGTCAVSSCRRNIDCADYYQPIGKAHTGWSSLQVNKSVMDFCQFSLKWKQRNWRIWRSCDRKPDSVQILSTHSGLGFGCPIL